MSADQEQAFDAFADPSQSHPTTAGADTMDNFDMGAAVDEPVGGDPQIEGENLDSWAVPESSASEEPQAMDPIDPGAGDFGNSGFGDGEFGNTSEPQPAADVFQAEEDDGLDDEE